MYIILPMFLLFYMALGLINFDREKSITRAIRTGWPWKSTQMALASLVAISGPKRVSIFRAHPFQWPSKWIFSHQNHFVPRHLNNRYINNYISKWRREFQNPKYRLSSYVPFAIVILDYKTSPVFSLCFILTNFMMFFLSTHTVAQMEN